MPYLVNCPPEESILVPTVQSEVRDPRTKELIGLEIESVTYYAGDTVPDERLSPTLVEAYNAGDPHVTNILSRIGDAPKPAKPARQKPAAKAKPDEENPFLDTAAAPAGNPSAGPRRVEIDEAPIGQSGGLPGRKVVEG